MTLRDLKVSCHHRRRRRRVGFPKLDFDISFHGRDMGHFIHVARKKVPFEGKAVTCESGPLSLSRHFIFIFRSASSFFPGNFEFSISGSRSQSLHNFFLAKRIAISPIL